MCMYVVAQSLSCVWLLVTPWTAAHQGPLSSTVSQSLLKFMSIESVMLFNHPILCCPLLLPSIFPSIRVFSNELALHIRWPKYWNFNFSFSLSPHEGFFPWVSSLHQVTKVLGYIQGWFPLGLTGLICSPRDSHESFLAQFESISSLVLRLLYGSTLISVHDYWKNHNFD